MRTYDVRYQHLRDLGFPAKTILALEKYAPKLHTRECVDTKLEWLRARGFADPVDLIAGSPQILRATLEAIDRKLRYARRLPQCPIDVVSLITRNPFLLAYSLSRIRLCVRIAYAVPDADETFFITIITKHAPLLAAAALAAACASKKAIRKELRVRKDLHTENELFVTATRGKIAQSYRRYREAASRRHT